LGLGQHKGLQCPSLLSASLSGSLPASVLRAKLHLSILKIRPTREGINCSVRVSQNVAVNENLLHEQRNWSHDYLVGLLKACVGYEATLDANNKELGKVTRHKK
jgi:hypothetical protein